MEKMRQSGKGPADAGEGCKKATGQPGAQFSMYLIASCTAVSTCTAPKLGSIFTLGNWVLLLFHRGIKQHQNISRPR